MSLGTGNPTGQGHTNTVRDSLDSTATSLQMQAAGFSIVTYTGNNQVRRVLVTVFLGDAPELSIPKKYRDATAELACTTMEWVAQTP